MGAVTTSADRAVARESEALEYPDERGEILFEAISAWRRAGHSERAYELAAEVVAEGGTDGCYARCQRIDFLIEDGHWERSATELTELARQPALDDGHCQMIAELLVESGDLRGASRWYDRAVARLDQATVAQLRGPEAAWSLAATIVRGRQDVRRQLGVPPDTTDMLVPDLPSFDRPRTPPTTDEILEELEAGGTVPRLRLTVFPRAERAEARRRWPESYTGTDEEYFTATELGWRRLQEAGAHAIEVVPVTVRGLVAYAERTGGSPTDSAVKTRYAATVADTDGVAWPPPRNAPCWCGSTAKYKKCCGRPGLVAAS